MDINYLNLSSSLLEPMEPFVPRDYSLADWKYEKIKEEVEAFQAELDDDTDVCVLLASFGTSMVMHVTGMNYQNPDMLYFYGYINGNKTQLIQHMSQLNFVLMAVKKDEPERPARRIGFSIESED